MEWTIRAASGADYQAFEALYAEGDAYHARGAPNLFRPARPSRSVEHFAAYLADGGQVLIAEAEGRAAGLVQFKAVAAPDLPFMCPRRYVNVDGLIVTEDCRRQGIGRALMEQVHLWAAEQGIVEIELNVHEFNQAALRLYESLGYRTARRRMLRCTGEDGAAGEPAP